MSAPILSTVTAEIITSRSRNMQLKEGFGETFPPTPPHSDSASIIDTISETNDDSIPLPPPSEILTKVLDIDARTPDFHVPRDPRLLRLTGAHPFNVEPPLSTLYDSGFLTPPELFYVRNHGAVPQILDEDIPDWDISIEGLVENPITLTFREILSNFEQVTLPITLVCAGNRRKEQNQVRKSNGFSWGPGGLSTSLFTGPILADILKVAKPMRRARFLCMEGADNLPNGKYGTSIRLSQAMDPQRGIMLAHRMNGEPLIPDHGRPIRVVVPSQIGGRSVKWLKRLILSETPSDNWYHLYDNRVLPTMVTPEMAKKDKKWWYDERYAIYDLSVNSAVAYPANEEKVSLNSGISEYKVRGYAYAGGMRRVTRVEVSLDKGKTWRLADINYPEDRYRECESETTLFGGRLDMSWRDTCFCWCFWTLSIPISSLASAEDIVVRAMDESMNTQPRDMYWSVLGMLHNMWFRVAIRKDEEGVLRFEHPTHPTMPGGWMDRVKKEGGDFSDGNWGEARDGDEERVKTPVKPVEEVKMTKDDVKRTIEIDELRKHDNGDAPWFVVKGEVYDGTAFLKEHPGGAQSIISAAGLDATDDFMAIHSETAKAMMPQYHIGSLSESSRAALREPTPTSAVDREFFLNPRAWAQSTLVSKKVISWDTRIFTFKLENEKQVLGLPVGQHLLLKVKDASTDEAIIRAYTPMSKGTDTGFLNLLVKVYFATPNSKGGKMTMALDSLATGSSVEFKGPIGKLEYLGRGRVRISGKKRQVGSFLMICAGSGITPIFQVLRAVMEDAGDSTRCVVLDGNREEEDILCREELDAFGAQDPNKCDLIYTLSKPNSEWKGLKGRVNGDLIRRHMPKENPLVLICGPENLEKSVHAWFKENGWSDEDLVFF